MAAGQGLRASTLRTLGFARREILGVFRQPRLLLTLILMPFAILLVFGLGYRTQPPPFQTLLVLPSSEAQLAAEEEFLSDAFGGGIDFVGTTSDATEARSRLRSGTVDLLIIGPADALNSLEEGEQAEFLVVHSEVDPVIRTSIDLLAELSVEELNRLILSEVVAEAQAESETLDAPLEALRSETGSLIEALENNDTAAEDASRNAVSDSLDQLEEETAASSSLYSSVSESLGTERDSVFDDLRSQLEATEGADGAESARDLDARLDEFEQRLQQLQETDPDLLVSPFAARVQDIANLPSTPALFYAPGVLIVLVQHLAVTFAVLSLVRERQLGLTELFRASPLRPAEILLGKFMAFLVMASMVAAILMGAILAFGVTLQGNPWNLALVVVLVTSASLGLGFVLSSAAQTDGQAVQYTMMVLLVSIFFTGLILPLEQLIPAVRAVSFLVPGTYGIAALHDIMFRGLRPDVLLVGGLATYGIILLAASWFVMRRHVYRSG
ncbi:MAG: ABC transporter permease [Actinomycetota bacterium]